MSAANPEITVLALTAVLTALLCIPYLLERIARLGVWGTLAYPPRSDEQPVAAWADRARRAHANAVENLVVFGALVVAVELNDGGNDTTAFAAWLFLGARVSHPVVYALGVPVLRTLSFMLGLVACLILAGHVLF